MRAAWWRRAIDLTGKYLTQRDWAQTSEDAHEWTRLAVLASRLTNVLADLYEDEVERTDLVKLAKAQVLIDQGSKSDRRDVPVRTARKVVQTCDELMVNISKSADSSDEFGNTDDTSGNIGQTKVMKIAESSSLAGSCCYPVRPLFRAGTAPAGQLRPH